MSFMSGINNPSARPLFLHKYFPATCRMLLITALVLLNTLSGNSSQLSRTICSTNPVAVVDRGVTSSSSTTTAFPLPPHAMESISCDLDHFGILWESTKGPGLYWKCESLGGMPVLKECEYGETFVFYLQRCVVAESSTAPWGV